MTYDKHIVTSNVKRNLQNFKEANGLFHKDIAAALDVDESTYRSWATGRSAPKNPMLIRIAKLLNISLEELLYGKQDADEIDFDDEDTYGDKYLSELSKEEKIIVMKVRQLNTEDRNKITEFISSLTKNL